MDGLIELGKLATALGATGGVGLAVWRFGVRPATRRLHAARRFLARVSGTCELVERELKPNGGGSMRDTVARMDLRLTSNEARSRAMIEQSRLSVFESDAEGAVVYASSNFCRMVGRTPADLLGRGWFSIVHPDDRKAVIAEWDACAEQHRDFSWEFHVTQPNGASVPVIGQAFVMRGGQGVYLGKIGLLTQRDSDQA